MKFPLFLAALSVLNFVATAAEKPDVLVILTDQWSPRCLSWDDPQVRTPNLDRIAREGMIFDACYVTSPVCMPSRVSLLTGLYPHNHGHALWSNSSGYSVPVEAASMFRDIQGAGYATAQIGKLHWSSGPQWKEQFATVDEFYRAIGLDHVISLGGPLDSDEDRSPYADHLRKLGVLGDVASDMRQRYVKNQYEPRASLVKAEDYHDTFTTSVAVDFIRQQPKGKPLCLVVSLHAPHPPLDAPVEFATMFDPEKLTLPANVPEVLTRDKRRADRAELRRMLANYLGKIALADQCIGRLMEAMQARGTWENTLVCFTADHGEMMGAHGFLSKGRFYEESVRVPLVVRWPGHVKAGRTPALAQMMDVYPTIVEAVGGKLSPGRFATSLWPVATGSKESVRDLAVSEIGTKAPLHIMARDERFKYWADEDREYLFDLANDPLEQRDLAEVPEQRETLHEMRGKLLAFLRSTQVNFAEGYKGKVQRLRAEEAAKDPAVPAVKKKKAQQ